jgi:hypothetical protein
MLKRLKFIILINALQERCKISLINNIVLDYVWWTVKDWEGCDLFEGKIPASAWND